MRRRTLLVIGVIVGAVAVGSLGVFFLGFQSTTADCGLGMGGVNPLKKVDATVDSPSDARQALKLGWRNDSDKRNVRDAAQANFSTYEHVDLVTSFREDIRERAEGEVFNKSETVYYFAVNGSRNGYQGYSTIGVTESGVIFQALYGSC